jgi:hypothetical protein
MQNGNSAWGALGALLPIGYFLLGIFQLAAIMAGAQVWWGLGTISSGIVGFVLAYIPIVGTLAGIAGAHSGFHWSWPFAALLFLWPYALAALAMGISAAFSKVASK